MDRRSWAIGPGLRLVASVAMLAVLLPRVRISALLPTHRVSALAWLFGALVVTAGAIVLSALRWQKVLRALGLPTRLAPLAVHHFAGLFVSNFLPSTIGGDVLRVRRLAAANGESAGTFASVVLERLTGWLVLPVITLTALAVNPGLLRLGTATRVAVAVSVTTLVLLVGILALAASPALGGRLVHRENWLRFLGAVHLGIERFRRAPGAAAEVLAAGFLYQLAVVLAAFLASEALGLSVGWTAILAFMPAVAMVQVLPVTFGGLGVREGAFVLFLHPLGIGTEQAITLGLLVYAVNLLVSLLGAPAFALGNRPAGAVASA